jgi:hypothetical protein
MFVIGFIGQAKLTDHLERTRQRWTNSRVGWTNVGQTAFVAAPFDELHSLRAISLDELDERAALLRRLDVKYIAGRELVAQVIERLGEDHDVLKIDGRREFGYDTVYFDTDDLRCFRDHARDVKPRFKARTRRYVDAGACVFEVKVKREDGDTDKRQMDHEVAPETFTPEAERLVEETLRDAGVEPPGELAPVLRTTFRRITLAAREGGARLTIDLGVTLATLDGRAVRMRDGLALVETKSEDGDSPADGVLREFGAERLSLSKYRTGVDALLRRDESGEVDQARSLFAGGLPASASD